MGDVRSFNSPCQFLQQVCFHTSHQSPAASASASAHSSATEQIISGTAVAHCVSAGHIHFQITTMLAKRTASVARSHLRAAAPVSALHRPLHTTGHRPRHVCCKAAGDEPSEESSQEHMQQQQQQQQQDASQQPPAPAPVTPSSSSSTSSANGMYSVMTALAAAGALETSYLAATKLLNTTAACPTGGCDTVLNSAFGSLFGLPLPLYGAATYTAVAAAAAAAAAAVAADRPVPGWLSTGLAAGVAVLASTSAGLMGILHTQLGGASCVWCYASAGLSAGLFAALLAGMDRRQMAAAAGPGLGGTVAALAALYVGFGPNLTGANAAELELAYANPIVTTSSSEQALSLAHRLKEAGAKMYGAFWCTHCYDQKQEFGEQAMAEFPYVECFPQGWKKGVKIAPACEAASVKAFPTWVIGGTVTEGQLDLSQLEELLAQAQAAGDSSSSSSSGAEAAAVAVAQ